MQDVCSLEKRMAWQYDRMFGVTAHITGMPGGKGAPSGFDAAFLPTGYFIVGVRAAPAINASTHPPTT